VTAPDGTTTARHRADEQRRFVAATQSGVTEVPLPLTTPQSLIFDTQEIRATPDAAAVHEEMLRRIAALEDTFAKLPIAGIGHNKPPEPEPLPLAESEFTEIKVYIVFLKEQSAVPAQLPTRLGVVARELKTLGQRVLDHLQAHAIEIGIAAVSGLGIWHEFGERLMALGNVVTEWLKALLYLL